MVCRTLIFSSLLDCFPNCMFFLSSYLVGSLKIVQVHFCNLVWDFFTVWWSWSCNWMKRERFLSGSECGHLFYYVFSQTTGRATGERMVAQWLQLSALPAPKRQRTFPLCPGHGRPPAAPRWHIIWVWKGDFVAFIYSKKWLKQPQI